MPDRLSPLDASFLYMEERTTAMTVGGVMTFEQPDGKPFDFDAFLLLIEHRLALVPRYRQKVREVPGRLGLPVWVDDPDFDLTFHVRRSALPAPGDDIALRELVGRLVSRQLDRSRPLWEIYVIEGFEEHRFAILTKTHHAMVDGLATMDIGAALLDETPDPRRIDNDEPWFPDREPSGLMLAAAAVVENMRRPRSAVDALTRATANVTQSMGIVRRAVGGVVDAVRTVRRGPAGALTGPTGAQRRFGMARTTLADHRQIRRRHCRVGEGSVNDVVLAVATGALRRWMISRGEPLPSDTVVRAMVPVSLRARRGTGGAPNGVTDGPAGNRIAAVFVALPVGEADPVVRLRSIAAQMAAHKRHGRAAGTTAVIGLAGLTGPRVHEMGARLSSRLSAWLFDVVVTHVPGPPRPLYAMGARMRDIFPLVPLAYGQTVAIGVTSYDGTVCYGLNADRDAMHDVDVLAAGIDESLAELLQHAPVGERNGTPG